MCLLVLIQLGVLYNVVITFGTKAEVTDEEYALMPQLFHLDDFDRCMVLHEKALYCTITLQLEPLEQHNHSVTWKIIDEVRKDPRNYRHDLIRHGICVPTSCPNAITNDEDLLKFQISECYTNNYQHLNLKAVVTEMHCQTQQPEYLIDKYDIAVAALFGVLIGIVMFASLYEGIARYKPKDQYDKIINTKAGRFLACFSIPKNWNQLSSRSSGSCAEELNAIQGIRFYLSLLVMIAHTQMFAIAGPVINPTYAENMTRKPEHVFYTNGYCIIQAFMVITGFLLVHNLLTKIGKRKKLDSRFLMLYFLNRYIRLTPCLLVMAAFHATWLYHLSRGPMWDKFIGMEYRNCRKNWWSNLLFINNYYDKKNMCMQNTWYLATDMQLYLLSLLVVSIMWKYQNRIKLILGICVFIGVTTPAAINYYLDYDISMRHYPEVLYHLFANLPQWHRIYSSSITNFGGYAIGMVFGYLYHTRGDRKIFTNKICVAVWWILVSGCSLGVIYYGLFFIQDGYKYTRTSAAIYASLHKNLFAFSVGLFIYGTTEGVGWFLRYCVLWSPLQVLGKLTYCVYLVHMLIMRVRGGQARLPQYLTMYNLFIQGLGDMLLGYIYATLLALFVELPASALQQLIVPQPSRDTELQEQNIDKISTNPIKDFNTIYNTETKDKML